LENEIESELDWSLSVAKPEDEVEPEDEKAGFSGTVGKEPVHA